MGLIGKAMDQSMQGKQTVKTRTSQGLDNEQKKAMNEDQRKAMDAYLAAVDDLATAQKNGADPERIKDLKAALATRKDALKTVGLVINANGEIALATTKVQAGSAQGGGGVTTTQSDVDTDSTYGGGATTPAGSSI